MKRFARGCTDEDLRVSGLNWWQRWHNRFFVGSDGHECRRCEIFTIVLIWVVSAIDDSTDIICNVINSLSDVFMDIFNEISRAFNSSINRITDPVMKVICKFTEISIADVLTPFMDILNSFVDKLAYISSDLIDPFVHILMCVFNPFLCVFCDILDKVRNDIDDCSNPPSPPVLNTNLL